jgi:hypothetical protein
VQGASEDLCAEARGAVSIRFVELAMSYITTDTFLDLKSGGISISPLKKRGIVQDGLADPGCGLRGVGVAQVLGRTVDLEPR